MFWLTQYSAFVGKPLSEPALKAVLAVLKDEDRQFPLDKSDFAGAPKEIAPGSLTILAAPPDLKHLES
jgi:hypothetical protein